MLSFTPYPNSKETCSLQLKARFREIPGRMNHPWYKQNHFELEVCEIGLTRLLSINTFFLRGVFGPACRNILSGASKISIDVSTEIFFGRPAINSAAKMRSTPLFVWYPDAEMTGGFPYPIMSPNHAKFFTLKRETRMVSGHTNFEKHPNHMKL